MTHLKYLLPNYERGDRYLRKTCQRAHRFTHPFRLCNDPAEPGMKLTYGYLGNIARHARRCQQIQEKMVKINRQGKLVNDQL